MSAVGLWLLLAGAGAATYVWRGAGAALGAHIHLDSAAFRWVAAIAYATLAALIARMLVLPLNSLADAPLWHRLAATVVALLVFFLARHNTLFGVLAGAVALVALSIAGG